MKTFLLFYVFLSLTSFAHGWGTLPKAAIPNDVLQLSGAFKGFDSDSTKRSEAFIIIYPLTEGGEPNGRFDVFLLYGDKGTAQVFEGTKMKTGGYRIGLKPVGLDSTGRYIDIQPDYVSMIELKITKEGTTLLLRPVGQQNIQEKTFEFDRYSDDIQIGPTLPSGYFEYKNHDSLNASRSDDGSASISVNNSYLGLKGSFYTIFQLTGLMALRGDDITQSGAEYPDLFVGGILVSVKNGSREAVILGKIKPNGSPSSVEIMYKK